MTVSVSTRPPAISAGAVRLVLSIVPSREEDETVLGSVTSMMWTPLSWADTKASACAPRMATAMFRMSPVAPPFEAMNPTSTGSKG